NDALPWFSRSLALFRYSVPYRNRSRWNFFGRQVAIAQTGCLHRDDFLLTVSLALAFYRLPERFRAAGARTLAKGIEIGCLGYRFRRLSFVLALRRATFPREPRPASAHSPFSGCLRGSRDSDILWNQRPRHARFPVTLSNRSCSR